MQRPDDGTDPLLQDEVAPWRRDLDRHFVQVADRLARALVEHWLALVNAIMGALAVTPALAPLLLVAGLDGPANLIYRVYSLTCHQLPHRSFYLSGYQMAFCQRDFAIYSSVFLAGLLFALLRRRLRPLDWRLYLLLSTPMAVDGTLQLFGWHESTWELRTVTGTLFGTASVWLVYPYFEQAMNELRALWHGHGHPGLP